MRVLQFGRFHHEARLGGIERHVTSLCEGLAAAGVQVVNLVAADHQAPSDEFVQGYRRIRAASFGIVASTAMSPALILAARRLHAEQPFDLFHLHFPDPLSHLASMCLPRTVPRVLTWHSDIVRQRKLLRLYGPWLNRELKQVAALVAATSQHFESSTQAPRDFPAHRKHVIPYGLDFEILAPNAVSSEREARLRSLAAGRPMVFALGRHVYYKGFEYLIRAMVDLPNAVLILGGDGPLRESLEVLAQTVGVADRTHFVGRVPDAELGAYYRACDVFCLPSVEPSEAFGLVQLEAMACGRPAVCCTLGNGVNVVNTHGVTGLAVPPRNPQALANALRSLLEDDRLRHQLGEQAHARAWGTYSQQAMVERHLALYHDVLATSQS